MEYLKKPVWNKYTGDELRALSVSAPDVDFEKKILKNWDRIAKPLDSMGKFESFTAKIGAITKTERIDIKRRALIVMCADNGIVNEGVSQCGQQITSLVAEALGRGVSSACVLAGAAGTDIIPVDVGINSSKNFPGVINRKIRPGTVDFMTAPAMDEKKAVKAVSVGIDMAFQCKRNGYKILAVGEMGIGNTTTSSALAAALLKLDAGTVTGRGAGLSDEALERKKFVISSAIEKYDLYNAEPLAALSAVGGLDIAAMAGICVGCALCSLPVVIDGAISAVSALLAEKLVPGTKEYCLPSHRSRERVYSLAADELDFEPVIDAGMALGEGTGALMLFPLLDMALSLYHNGLSFGDMKMESYKRHSHNERAESK